MQMTTIHPILMRSDFSVPRILQGQKTQTRRDVNLRDINDSPDEFELVRTVTYKNKDETIAYLAAVFQDKDGRQNVRVCPYGDEGHWLWVRENFAPDYFGPGKPGYKADWDDSNTDVVPEPTWKPSIHMPKKAARLWLKVKDIRIEQLGTIKDEDCIREGIEYQFNGSLGKYHFKKYTKDSFDTGPNVSFLSLWETLFNQEITTELLKKWVWVIEFAPYKAVSWENRSIESMPHCKKMPDVNEALEHWKRTKQQGT